MPSSQTPAKINIYDSNVVKQVLDDHLVKILINEEFKEDVQLSNQKIILGLLSCGLAALSHFWPTPFPHNKTLLIFCVVSYMILSAALQYIATYKEKDFIFLTQSRLRYSDDAMEVASTLKKYGEIYTMSLAKKGLGTKKVEKSVSITKYFYSDGVFAEDKFEKDVKQMLKEFLGLNLSLIHI
eukprot:TRINITY_DN4721_c0_g1_i4.p1 TRINITY_DN4721_c0_g1~~TRINITY_DN4721_c0_g1_i4.p1  ORF type:complete len:183 (+),score=23.16 TRINITY_DN4721_c0_g1_i4:90-638(+)